MSNPGKPFCQDTSRKATHSCYWLEYLGLFIAIQKQAILLKYVFTFPKIAWQGSVGFGKSTWAGFNIACTICLLVICNKHAWYVAVRKYFLWLKCKWVLANRFYAPLEITSETDGVENILRLAKKSQNISRTWSSHHVNLNILRCIGCYIVWVINTCIPAVHHLLAPVKHRSKWKIICSMLAMFHFLMLQYLQLAPAASAHSPPVSSPWTDSVVGPQTAAGEQPRPAETTFSASECYMGSCVTSDVNS